LNYLLQHVILITEKVLQGHTTCPCLPVGPMTHTRFPSIIELSNDSYKLFICIYIDGFKHLGQQTQPAAFEHQKLASYLQLSFHNFLFQSINT